MRWDARTERRNASCHVVIEGIGVWTPILAGRERSGGLATWRPKYAKKSLFWGQESFYWENTLNRAKFAIFYEIRGKSPSSRLAALITALTTIPNTEVADLIVPRAVGANMHI